MAAWVASLSRQSEGVSLWVLPILLFSCYGTCFENESFWKKKRIDCMSQTTMTWEEDFFFFKHDWDTYLFAFLSGLVFVSQSPASAQRQIDNFFNFADMQMGLWSLPSAVIIMFLYSCFCHHNVRVTFILTLPDAVFGAIMFAVCFQSANGSEIVFRVLTLFTWGKHCDCFIGIVWPQW